MRTRRMSQRQRIALHWRTQVGVTKILDGISDLEFVERMERAMLWHGPFNWPGGDSEVCAMYGFDYLFPDAREMEGLKRSRYYFDFDSIDCTDWVKVAKAFLECPNYEPYFEVWKKHAPEELRDEVFFMGSLVKMTVKGKRFERKLIETKKLIKSDFEEDYFLGVDAYLPDGTPIQIKTPATMRGL